MILLITQDLEYSGNVIQELRNTFMRSLHPSMLSSGPSSPARTSPRWESCRPLLSYRAARTWTFRTISSCSHRILDIPFWRQYRGWSVIKAWVPAYSLVYFIYLCVSWEKDELAKQHSVNRRVLTKYLILERHLIFLDDYSSRSRFRSTWKKINVRCTITLCINKFDTRPAEELLRQRAHGRLHRQPGHRHTSPKASRTQTNYATSHWTEFRTEHTMTPGAAVVGDSEIGGIIYCETTSE